MVERSGRIAAHYVIRLRADCPDGSGGSGEAGALEVLQNAAPLDRLCKDNVRACLMRACKLRLSISGNDHDTRVPIARVREDLADEDVARNIGQPEVAVDHV